MSDQIARPALVHKILINYTSPDCASSPYGFAAFANLCIVTSNIPAFRPLGSRGRGSSLEEERLQSILKA